LTVMAYLAARTERIRIGVGVLVVPHRNPVVTAKQLATIDALSKGRLIVGVGVGWMAEEFATLHTPPFKERGKVTDEYLEIFRKLWTGEPVRHDGAYYQFEEIQSNPKPANPEGIPIWVGGYSKPAFRRVGRYGNGWHGMNFGADTVGGAIAEVRRAAEGAGRSPDDLTISVLMNVDSSGTPLAANPLAATESGRLLMGTVEEKIDQIRAFQRAGVDTLQVAFSARDLDTYLREMENFAQNVMPQVHERQS
ncbi:MAG TPA: TIGR03619 family F420-dependent LLM class oxidoreductase, partial [Dehalococcoidia bacterium]|nr:TIGR03619 family F420-dependent LLM class oxidoreductase [Dehalococcoidia bacterium]